MNENNENYQNEYDSWQDDPELQYHTEQDLGADNDENDILKCENINPMPVVIGCFVCAAFFLVIGVYSLFCNSNNTSLKLAEIFSPDANPIFVVFSVMALFSLLVGLPFLRRVKTYHREQKEMESEMGVIDETVEEKIMQRTCPRCGDSHDMDYPQCPKCKYRFFE